MDTEKKKPILIILSAPSGAGKTTLCCRLLDDFPEQVALSISSTTRSPRGNETHGKNYFFLTQDEFKKQIDSDSFAEWAVVHGHYYGTSKKMVNDFFNKGRSVLLDIDVQGAEQLRKGFPDRTYSVFISPPSLDELESRLRSRGTDSEEVICQRIQNAKKEMGRSEEFDVTIVNDDLDRAYSELKELVSKKII